MAPLGSWTWLFDGCCELALSRATPSIPTLQPSRLQLGTLCPLRLLLARFLVSWPALLVLSGASRAGPKQAHAAHNQGRLTDKHIRAIVSCNETAPGGDGSGAAANVDQPHVWQAWDKWA